MNAGRDKCAANGGINKKAVYRLVIPVPTESLDKKKTNPYIKTEETYLFNFLRQSVARPPGWSAVV